MTPTKPNFKYLYPDDAELLLAWATFDDPVALNDGETWQYMGTEYDLKAQKWEHVFRHRFHPQKRARVYKKIDATTEFNNNNSPFH